MELRYRADDTELHDAESAPRKLPSRALVGSPDHEMLNWTQSAILSRECKSTSLHRSWRSRLSLQQVIDADFCLWNTADVGAGGRSRRRKAIRRLGEGPKGTLPSGPHGRVKAIVKPDMKRFGSWRGGLTPIPSVRYAVDRSTPEQIQHERERQLKNRRGWRRLFALIFESD